VYVRGPKTPLYPNCKKGHKKLHSTLELLQRRVANGMSDKGLNYLLKLMKKMLIEGNKFPATTYEVKEVVSIIGSKMQKIYACSNDCIPW
jgi:hypothetical protein